MKAFASKLEVAATTRNTPSRSPASKFRCFQWIALECAYPASATVRSGETTVTRAPERNMPPILPSAIGPPPTTKQGFPPSFRNIGKSAGCCALILRLREEYGPPQDRARRRRHHHRQDKHESLRTNAGRRIGVGSRRAPSPKGNGSTGVRWHQELPRLGSDIQPVARWPGVGRPLLQRKSSRRR